MSTIRLYMLSSVHYVYDTRIYHKEARTLAQAGFDVTVFARPDPTGQAEDGVRVTPLPSSRNRLQRIPGTLRLGALALREPADIYVIHDPELIPVALALKFFSRGIVVYDVHEDVPKQIMAKEWLPKPVRFAVAALYRIAERVALRFVDGLVLAEKSYQRNYPKHRSQIVLNCPLLAYVKEDRQEAKADRPTLVYVGSIRAIRGLYEMVRLVDSLRASHPEILLRLIGPIASPDEESRLGAMLRSLELEAHVERPGRVSHAEVHRLIARSDIGLALLHPDPNYVDSLPTKMFEYMLMEKPVVVSDFPLWREIVVGNQCGLVVDPLDPDGVREAADQLLRNPGRRLEMGRQGRQTVVREFAWEIQGEKLVDFYRGLLPGRSQLNGSLAD